MEEPKQTTFIPMKVNHGGKEYEVIIPVFIYKGEIFTAEEVVKSEMLMSELMAVQWAGIREVTEN